MNVLIIGSGGREHAIAMKMSKSPIVGGLFVLPGNAGTREIGTNVELSQDNFGEIEKFARDNFVELIVVGPEQPLVDGIMDYFLDKDIKVVGPDSNAAQLEGSKSFAKAFMEKYGIPTAKYRSFSSSEHIEAIEYLNELRPPYVLKADGLAAGKGVLILEDRTEAESELKKILTEGKFGAAGSSVVIEQFLQGIEMSVFVLTDGKDYLVLPEAKDYKRIGEADTGLNTGGMGAVSPVPFADETLKRKIEEKIVQPSVRGIFEEKMNYKGFLFIGLMIVENEPYVIEYNVRMGDPETEVVMPRIKSDLMQHLLALFDGSLAQQKMEISNKTACTVMMVSGGYPEQYEKGKEIKGIKEITGAEVYHCGTKMLHGKLLTNGGRVLCVTSLEETLQKALQKSYSELEKVSFEGSYYRKDIGSDLQN